MGVLASSVRVCNVLRGGALNQRGKNKEKKKRKKKIWDDVPGSLRSGVVVYKSDKCGKIYLQTFCRGG